VFMVMGIGETLRALREAKGMSQPKLAFASGVSTGTISRIERGDTAQPDLETLSKLAAALGTEPETFASSFAAARQPAVAEPRGDYAPAPVDRSDAVLAVVRMHQGHAPLTDDEIQAVSDLAGWLSSSPTRHQAIAILDTYVIGLRAKAEARHERERLPKMRVGEP
jgi:transcriptional regulator with XRE-family HTH domain